jgi:hypothetical protein
MVHYTFTINLADIFAVIFSIVAIYIALVNRRNTLRENVFNRQIDALEAIMSKLHELVIEIITYQPKENVDDDQKEINAIYDEFNKLHFDKLLILPKEIDNKLDDYKGIVKLIMLDIQGSKFIELVDGYYNLVNEIRNFMGVTKLTVENRELVK